jgi:glycosyltransferase involved in cell wall biosynthesis
MEFQHAGYNVLRAKEIVGNEKFPKWLATNWGSDIYYYRNFPDHLKQISRLLQSVDYYSCECERDVGLARELGLRAPSLPVLPNSGGFDLDYLSTVRGLLPPSKRKLLMVKGYQHFAGRALTALEAVLKCADVLKDFRIVVFSASVNVRERVEELRLFHGLNISILEYASHEKMLKYYAHARFYLGVSASDAISTSMLEAMAMGAFPIQTNTSCCEEWIEDGKSGFSIPHDNVDVIADRIRKALVWDDLVDKAAELNWATVQDRLDQRKLKPQILRFYEQILS